MTLASSILKRMMTPLPFAFITSPLTGKAIFLVNREVIETSLSARPSGCLDFPNRSFMCTKIIIDTNQFGILLPGTKNIKKGRPTFAELDSSGRRTLGILRYGQVPGRSSDRTPKEVIGTKEVPKPGFLLARPWLGSGRGGASIPREGLRGRHWGVTMASYDLSRGPCRRHGPRR